MLNFPYIFTFYSYKGGVGRSLALLNTAYTLAGRGRHVLVVDMDLEAPGIGNFLLRQGELAAPTTTHPLDVLDLLSEALAAVKAGGSPKDAAQRLPPISNYIRSVNDGKLAPLHPKIGQLGRLDFVVTACNGDYCRRWAEVGLQGLPQDQLIALSSLLHHYLKAQRFPHRPVGLEPFEPALATPYDYVLVDSRTGITELGGLCVGPLADRLVVVTGLNDQNVQGTLLFMKEAGIVPKQRAKDAPAWDEADVGLAEETEVIGLGPKPTLLVASPVPTGEIAFKRIRLGELGVLLGIQPIVLSYHPLMALLERVFVRDYPEEYLAPEYRNLTDHVMGQVRDLPAQLAAESGVLWNEKKAHAEAISSVVRLAPSQPELGIPLLMQLGDVLKSSTDDQFWAERQMYGLLSQNAPTRATALSRWGDALSSQAETKQGDLTDRLFEAACQKYAEALKFKPSFPEALYNWGNALSRQAQTQVGEVADRLFEAAYEKYSESLRLKPDKHEAFDNWGVALCAQARTKQAESAARLFESACRKYAEAANLNPNSPERLTNWGIALTDQARVEQGEFADRLLEAASRKYSDALKLNPDSYGTLVSWAAATINQSWLKTGDVRQQLRQSAREKLLAAERIRPGSGAFNLACVEASDGNLANAIEWLKKHVACGGRLSRKRIAGESDFNPVRDVPAFVEFLQTLPEA